jgi:hypothetical protein
MGRRANPSDRGGRGSGAGLFIGIIDTATREFVPDERARDEPVHAKSTHFQAISFS